VSEDPSLTRALARLHKHSAPEELRAVYETHTSVTVTRLAAAAGRSNGWVSKQLNRADTRMRPRGYQKRTPATLVAPPVLGPSPTVLRHRLSERLAALRTHAGLNQTEAADLVGVSPATVMRAENPQESPTKHLLRALCTCYEAPPQVCDELLRLWKDSRAPAWWTRQDLRVFGSRQTELGLRADARRVHGWSDRLVPELVQTAAYAHTIEAARGTEEPAEMAVAVLMAAQRRVRRRGIDQRYVLDEAVIRRRVGGAQVMDEQLTVLRTLAERGRIRVLTWDSGHCIPESPFELCSIPPLDETALCFPPFGKVYLGEPPTSAHPLSFFQKTMANLWEWAQGPEATVALIENARTQLSGAGTVSTSTFTT
jgi:transcriptional regulator with XRE-family HTH domain